jgi:hypothetical protein
LRDWGQLNRPITGEKDGSSKSPKNNNEREVTLRVVDKVRRKRAKQGGMRWLWSSSTATSANAVTRGGNGSNTGQSKRAVNWSEEDEEDDDEKDNFDEVSGHLHDRRVGSRKHIMGENNKQGWYHQRIEVELCLADCNEPSFICKVLALNASLTKISIHTTMVLDLF